MCFCFVDLKTILNQKHYHCDCFLLFVPEKPTSNNKTDTYKSYLVDPASSHMLVSKIKPCMSKYKHLYTVKLRTAHYISNSFFDGFLLHG